MDRDETVALFLACEAKRGPARAAALAEGKDEDDAREIAHEAARSHWNAWADALNAERKALEASGAWAAEKQLWGSLEPKNEAARAWMERAAASFSRCLFLVRGAEGTKEAAGEDKDKPEASDGPVKPIQLDNDVIDMRGFAFPGAAYFRSAAFSGDAYFRSAAFSGAATFQSAAFSGAADFRSAAFSGAADFRGQTFTKDVFFNGAKFGSAGSAGFGLATFERVAQFDKASFEGETDFRAVWGKRTFSLSCARFAGVPDFIQAHFEEAPRLDDVEVAGRLLAKRAGDEEDEMLSRLHRWLHARSGLYRSLHYIHRRTSEGLAADGAPRDMPARWRALKRLAIQGCDTDRELQFFSGEIRSARFAGDWPLPWPVLKASAWGGFLRFWAGMLYQGFSNFGRSLIRPFACWALCIAIFAAYFLGQSPEMARERKAMHRGGVYGQTIAYSTVAYKAARQPRAPSCTSEENDPLKSGAGKLKADDGNGFSGLVPQVRAQTNLVNEALSIAYHNAVIVLDGSGDSAHRAFGCLYGVERYGGNPVAYVPRSVAIASGVQKLLSAIFIFLFGLALRNMLKVK